MQLFTSGLPSTLADDGSGNLTFSGRWISTRNSAASAPAHALTGTWFTGGTTESTKPHFLIEPTGATSTSWNINGTGLGVNAPSGFTGNLLDLKVNGTSRLALASNGTVSFIHDVYHGSHAGQGIFFDYDSTRIRGRANTEFAVGGNVGVCVVSDVLTFGANIDLRLTRDAANAFAQRNGTNAQTFRIYNTFTSTTNHERGKLEWDSNVLLIGTEKGTTGGTACALELQTDGVTRIRIGAAGQIGVFGAAAVAQPAAIPNATDAASTQSGLNSVLAALRSLGWIAT